MLCGVTGLLVEEHEADHPPRVVGSARTAVNACKLAASFGQRYTPEETNGTVINHASGPTATTDDVVLQLRRCAAYRIRRRTN